MAFAGWRGMLGIWPAALTAGIAFAVPQFLVSNLHGPWLVDMVSASSSILALMFLLRRWQPKDGWKSAEMENVATRNVHYQTGEIIRSWLPWLTLVLCLFVWGLPQIKGVLEGTSTASAPLRSFVAPEIKTPGLHLLVQRSPPVAPSGAAPEKAIFRINWLSATGTGILVAALVSGSWMGFSVRDMSQRYVSTIWRIRYSLLTIACMLALGNVTKYSGTDATLGLALAQTGSLYPFFGTLLGWLGVALTGSDTASNVLFGSLQKITAEQAGLSPVLMGAANSTGGVMGKMIDAQSIVVASTATGFHGQEGAILRKVFWHSLALAVLVGILVYLQATVAPFTSLVVE